MVIRYSIYENKHLLHIFRNYMAKERNVCMYVYTCSFIFIQHYVVMIEFKRMKNESINMYQVMLLLRFFTIFFPSVKMYIYRAASSDCHRNELINLHELTESKQAFSLHLLSLPEVLYIFSRLYPHLI